MSPAAPYTCHLNTSARSTLRGNLLEPSWSNLFAQLNPRYECCNLFETHLKVHLWSQCSWESASNRIPACIPAYVTTLLPVLPTCVKALKYALAYLYRAPYLCRVTYLCRAVYLFLTNARFLRLLYNCVKITPASAVTRISHPFKESWGAFIDKQLTKAYYTLQVHARICLYCRNAFKYLFSISNVFCLNKFKFHWSSTSTPDVS